MNIQIFGKSKCFDTKKAERYFKERGIRVQSVDLPRYGLSAGEFASVCRAVGGWAALLDEKHPDAALVRCLASDTAREEKLLENPQGASHPHRAQRAAGDGGLLSRGVGGVEVRCGR